MSDLIETSDDSNDAKIRLLVCHTCKTIQPLPDYQGPVDGDETLMGRVAEHQYPGARRIGHDMDLGRVSESSWKDPQKQPQIIAEIQKNTKGLGEGEGLGDELYAVRSNYSEDAMSCWRFKHGRTSNCDDYMSDKMTLLADSVAERKDLGLDPKQRAKLKLCQFCPVHSVVMQRRRKAAGMYN